MIKKILSVIIIGLVIVALLLIVAKQNIEGWISQWTFLLPVLVIAFFVCGVIIYYKEKK